MSVWYTFRLVALKLFERLSTFVILWIFSFKRDPQFLVFSIQHFTHPWEALKSFVSSFLVPVFLFWVSFDVSICKNLGFKKEEF